MTTKKLKVKSNFSAFFFLQKAAVDDNSSPTPEFFFLNTEKFGLTGLTLFFEHMDLNL